MGAGVVPNWKCRNSIRGFHPRLMTLDVSVVLRQGLRHFNLFVGYYILINRLEIILDIG